MNEINITTTILYTILIIQVAKTAILSKNHTLDKLKLPENQNKFANDKNDVKNKVEQEETDIFNNNGINDAVKYGFDTINDLLSNKEPLWFKMGLFLDNHHPGIKVAEFGKPNKKALKVSHFGMITVEASKRIVESLPESISRQLTDFPNSIKSRMLEDECPLKGRPRCPLFSKLYRTYDGTCNNLKNPWKGAAMLPMQRFLSPSYEDNIQSIRRSVLGNNLPSAREISSKIHKDKNREMNMVTLMFMQWGQFIDHDITSVVKSRSFNGSVPRCCDRLGRRVLPKDLLHPSCLPIEVSEDDWFFGKFGIGCMEFLRSAPSTRINCDLGWREQINQVTSFIDASMIYGSDIETSESIRTFRNGKIQYGRGSDSLQPPDPPGGELCNAGALTTDCFQPGDGRVTEQPGLTALHTVWVRYHNQVASSLARFNPHWSDEKVYQETRKIVYSLIQHITYKEFLPILLGPEVLRLFELELLPKGFFEGYNPKIDSTIANSFSSAAYRFGHSMVQNSFVRTDGKHRPIFNNVSLHDEFTNFENIWSFGSVDRTLLGFCNQPAQRRDEFMCDELSNHLFQPFDLPFGMDLTAINIQRGRDHGIPSYTAWREPCGLTPIKDWEDLEKVFSAETLKRFRKVYQHVDDIDLFSGGLAEKPVRSAVVGPTFACIIAQQFLNLKKGDRFWYENGNFPSSFTPAQLQQIRKITFSNILCQTLDEIETIQPFAFLISDNTRNKRLSCRDPVLKHLDITPWIETNPNEEPNRKFSREGSDLLEENTSIENKSIKNGHRLNKQSNVTVTFVNNFQQSKREFEEKISTLRPLEVNIRIQYFTPISTTTPNQQTFSNNYNYQDKEHISFIRPQTQEVPNNNYFVPSNKPTFIVQKPIRNKPTFTINKLSTNNNFGYEYRPSEMYKKPTANHYKTPTYRPSSSSEYNKVVYEDKPFSINFKKPYKPITNHYLYNDIYTTKKPVYGQDMYEYFYQKYDNNNYNEDYDEKFNKPTSGYVHRVVGFDVNDKLDFKSRLVNKNKDKRDEERFVKISSIKSQASVSSSSAIINTVLQREGDDDILEENRDFLRLVDLDVSPSDVDDRNWLIYEENEEFNLKLDMPNVLSTGDECEEVPKPIKIKKIR